MEFLPGLIVMPAEITSAGIHTVVKVILDRIALVSFSASVQLP